jgi:hypothetical protein
MLTVHFLAISREPGPWEGLNRSGAQTNAEKSPCRGDLVR